MTSETLQSGQAGVLPAKQARSQRRQRAILDAAHRLVETVGYENMKMEQIAAEANSSVGTLYQRFSNKDALLDALLAETLERLGRQIEDELAPERLRGDRKAALHQLMVMIVNFMRDNQGFVRALTSRQLRDPEGVSPLQSTARVAIARTWEALIADDPALATDQGWEKFRVSVQMAIGLASNAVLNRPGPLQIDDPRMPGVLAAAVEGLLAQIELPL